MTTTASWFDRHKRFGDCKPNEVYIGQRVFAEFSGPSIVLRDREGGAVRIDHGSVTILAGALKEWMDRHG